MTKINKIAYELTKMWKDMTREEICEILDISNCSLYRFQKMLKLDKNMQNPISNNVNGITISMNTEDGKMKTHTFKSWKHLTVWSKAQSHPFKFISGNKVEMDYNRLTEDAKRYYASLK